MAYDVRMLCGERVVLWRGVLWGGDEDAVRKEEEGGDEEEIEGVAEGHGARRSEGGWRWYTLTPCRGPADRHSSTPARIHYFSFLPFFHHSPRISSPRLHLSIASPSHMSASTTTAYARLAPPHALVRGAPLPLRLRHPAHLSAVRAYVRSPQALAFTASAPVPLATLAALRTTRPQLLQLVPLASVRHVSTQPQESSLSPHSYPPPLQPQASAANRINLAEPAIGTPPPLPPTPQGSLPPKVTDLAASHEKAVEKEDEKKKPTGPLPARVWASVKKEAAHYWAGTKLLGQEIKISGKLQWKVLNGGTLTRRERRQVNAAVC